MTIKIMDKGAYELFKKLKGRLPRLKVGVFGSEAEKQYPDTELTVGDISASYEFGILGPELSWLRGPIDMNDGVIEQRLKKVFTNFFKDGTSIEKGFQELGPVIVRLLKIQAYQGKPVEIDVYSEDTEEVKTETFDVGDFINAIKWEVESGGKS